MGRQVHPKLYAYMVFLKRDQDFFKEMNHRTQPSIFRGYSFVFRGVYIYRYIYIYVFSLYLCGFPPHFNDTVCESSHFHTTNPNSLTVLNDTLRHASPVLAALLATNDAKVEASLARSSFGNGAVNRCAVLRKNVVWVVV